MHLARAASGRIGRLVVQLAPAHLGEVEIRLDFGDRDRIGAAVIADRPETLEALQRDAAALERSLRDAGFRTDGGGLSFTLRRDHQEREGQRHPAAAGAAGDEVSRSAAALDADAAGLQPLVRGLHLPDIEA